jgi:hypothetical protein
VAPIIKTKVINLFAGPGAGKSTTAAAVFAELKRRGYNAELVTEFAKDLVWEERDATFRNQIYIFAKQWHRIHRLLGKVDVIVTDSPILLSIYYDQKRTPYLDMLVESQFRQLDSLNFFIERTKQYNQSGRFQDESGAKLADAGIEDMLQLLHIPNTRITDNPHIAREIVSVYEGTLGSRDFDLNGQRYRTTESKMSYEDVCRAAGIPIDYVPTIVVSYPRTKSIPPHTMTRGQTVTVEGGMSFDVVVTGAA